MKILVVDDEALVRFGMRSIIPWEQHGYTIVGEASDGLSGLELAKKYKPDIVLVDIVMPQINGIELIKAIKQAHIACKFLILSCVSEIDYFQQAIALGVSGYILKSSITPGQILQEVNRVADEINRERVFVNTDLEVHSYINKITVLNEFGNLTLKKKIIDKATILEKMEASFLSQEDNSINLIVMDFQQTNLINTTNVTEYTIASFAQEMIVSVSNGCVFVNYEDVIWAIISYNTSVYGDNYIFDICNRLNLSLKQCMGISSRFGISTIERTDFDIPTAFKNAQVALYSSYIEPNNTVFFPKKTYSYIESKNKVMEIINICESSKDICTIIDNLLTLHTLLLENNILSRVQIENIYEVMIKNMFKIAEVSLNEVNATLPEKDLHSFIQSFGDYTSMHDEIIKLINITIKDNILKTNDTITEAIRVFIDNNINKRITLNSVASVVHMSPDYVCKYFKQKTGMNLSDYILQLKIRAAKKLLRSGHSISEITEKFAFSSDGHFIKTFKKYTGVTPGVYTKRKDG